MSGGTFTISNGGYPGTNLFHSAHFHLLGVYGSLMGTPIVNPPQSAILGMHAINKRRKSSMQQMEMHCYHAM